MADKMKGSVEQLPSGKYRLRVTVGRNENGNPKRLSKTVESPNIRKAYIELDKWIDDLEDKGYENIKEITFENFYQQYWLKEAERNLGPKTFLNYKKIIQKRYIEPFRNKKLTQIRPFQIKDIIINAKRIQKDHKGNISEKSLSRATKKQMLFALNNVFLVAINEYRLLEHNPCIDVKIPKELGTKKNVEEPYSHAEIQLFLSALENEDIETKAMLLTAFVTSARQGEIAALEENDVDFVNRTVTFHQRILEIDKQGPILVPGLKNGDETKTIIVPEYHLDIIKQLIERNEQLRQQLRYTPDHKYLFGQIDGTPTRGSYLYKKFKRFTKRHDLRHIRFHDLRHTSATFLLSRPEIDMKQVQEQLGHRSYNTTANIYAHILEEKKSEASNIFDGLLPKKD